MSLQVECYWSFRSPYSYLATPRMRAWQEQYALRFEIRVVYPLAVRVEGFFRKQHPQWLPYLASDCAREAQRLGLPFARPEPDPIQMNLVTGEVPPEQPYIQRLTRLGAAAAECGRGLDFIGEVSRLIWSGEVRGWHEGSHLAGAAARAGLDLAELDAAITREPEHYEQQIQANQQAHAAAGHWGVPLFVFQGEPFFGQDRMDTLLWRLRQHGLLDLLPSSSTTSSLS